MAADGNALSLLLRTKMDTKFRAVMDYAGPSAQQDPSKFFQMCDAIGKGIAQSSAAIQFTTDDTGSKGTPPVPGVGTGAGIIIDTAWFTQALYQELRSRFISQYGQTVHPEFSQAHNPYNFLTAFSEAISESVSQHYIQAWVLTSNHPAIFVGTGTISNGGFSGLSQSLTASAIQSLAPAFQGSAWPPICQAVGKAYAEAVMQHATGTVVISGVCVPSTNQVCGIPGTGSGSGVAA
jgi:hypothetical protein